MCTPVRVLHVLSKLSFGGVQTVVMNYYRNIDREKVQFDFVVQDKEVGSYESEVQSLGGHIYKIAPMHLDRKRFEKELMKILQSNKYYKIIHTHHNFSNIIPLRVAKKAGVPVRISHSHSNYKANSFFKELQRIVFRLLIPFYATDYFSCSIASAVWLYGKKNIRSSKLKIVHNAINTEKFVLDNDIRQRVRNELDINNNIVLIHVGMFSYSKNHEYLLEIFKQLLKINQQISLLLVGDGERKEFLLNLARSKGLEGKVFFLGIQERVQEFLMAADYFVFPSRYEGLPLTVIEAQISGLSCLISDVITPEVAIFNDVTFMSIKASPIMWAKTLIESFNLRRARTFNDIVSSGYEIKHEASELQQFYTMKNGN